MALTKMTVCEASSPDSAKFPYQFYAKKNSSDNQPTLVNLVMPIGGTENGFFRYPKKGETILVDNDGENTHIYYLIGYLPSDSDIENNFLTKKSAGTDYAADKAKLKNEEGMVLRYQQTGKKDLMDDAPDRYSEIGFYRRTTQWKPKTDEKGKYAAYTNELPNIDQINIQSTGDIRQSAKNFQEIKAKRLELLAGLESYDHAAYPGADYEYSFADIRDKYDEKLAKLPFGDSPGDDSNLYAGDMHLRAKNRVFIKAGDEIIIEVGRSSIVINDEGIALTTRKGRKKTVNLWDTTLLLSPQKGINLFGQNLQMEAVNIFELKDNYGGSIKSTSGLLRINGRDIKLSTSPTLKYLSNYSNVVTSFSQSISAIDGIHGLGEGAAFLLSNYGLIVNLVAGIIGGALNDTPDDDPIDLVLTLHGVLLSMNHLVVNLICDPKTPAERDVANRSAMIVDFTLNLAFTAAILTGPGFVSGFKHNAALHLRGSAHIALNSLSYMIISTEMDDVSSPVAGLVKTLKEWAVGKVGALPKAALVIAGVIGAGLGASLPGVYIGAIQETDKKTIAELQEL
jgi:hypothetical protein